MVGINATDVKHDSQCTCNLAVEVDKIAFLKCIVDYFRYFKTNLHDNVRKKQNAPY